MTKKFVNFSGSERRALWEAADKESIRRADAGIPNERGRPPRAGDVICEWARSGRQMQSGIASDAGVSDDVIDRNVRARGGVISLCRRIRRSAKLAIQYIHADTPDSAADPVRDMLVAQGELDRIAREWGNRAYLAGYRAGIRTKSRPE